MANGVSAIILAAGRSKRMGRPKQLLPLDGIPLVEHVLKTLAASAVDEIVLVAGDLFDSIAKVSRKYHARMIRNPYPASDMATSVRTGISAARVDTGGVLVVPADYPLVHAETVDALLREHVRTPRQILVPTYDGRRGHPSLFPRVLLGGIGYGMTLRDIIRMNRDAVQHVQVNDSGILIDIDTPEEYAMVVKKQQT